MPLVVGLVVAAPFGVAAMVVVGVTAKNSVPDTAATAVTRSGTGPPGAASAPASAANEPPPSAGSGEQTPVGPGTHRGGDTIAVGRYVTEGPGDTSERCRYTLSSDPDGDRIIAAAGDVTGRTEINVWLGNYLSTHGCLPWRRLGPPQP